MKPSTQRALSMVLAAVFIVFGLVIFSTLVSGAYDQVQRLRGELSAKSNLFQVQSHQLAQVQNLISQYQGITRLQDSLNLALPLQVDTVGAIIQINAIAQKNGLTIGSINFDPLVEARKEAGVVVVKDIGTLNMTLKLTGSYSSFKNFLSDLESNIRIMDVTSLKMAPAGREAGEDSFNFDLTVSTYYQT